MIHNDCIQNHHLGGKMVPFYYKSNPMSHSNNAVKVKKERKIREEQHIIRKKERGAIHPTRSGHYWRSLF